VQGPNAAFVVSQPPAGRAASVPVRQIFAAFVRLGATAFGGPAIVAHLRADLVDRRRWLSDQAFADGLALCQMIPGATMVQLATYAGRRIGGGPGAVAAAVGFVLPSFVAMTVLTALYLQTGSLPVVRTVFRGLGALVVALVLNATLSLGQVTLREWQGGVLAALALLALALKVGVVAVAGGVAALALLIYPRRASGPQRRGLPRDPAAAEAPVVTMSRRGWTVAAAVGIVLLVGPLPWNPRLSQLDLVLMKLSVLAFGGGFPLIPLMQHDIVDRLQWLTVGEFMDGVALGQVTPGPILITATFVGYRVGGLAGAITATLAVFLPSFLILMAVAPHFDRLKSLEAAQTMIRGVLAGFVGLLLFVLYQFARASLVDWRTWALAAGALVALRRRVDLLVLVGATIAASLLMLH